MVHIQARNLSLRYAVHRTITLSTLTRQAATGGRLGGDGRSRWVDALGDVSFELQSGDRLGLVGTNGAGKTTLLKVLSGIYDPTGGDLSINGRVDALFNINLGFRPGATGRRNIQLRCLINGWSDKEIKARMDEIIAFSELGEFIDMPLKTYSQGMAARLAFSIATSMNPEILLLDEWIGAGDPPFQEKARARMNSLADQAGIIVLASHNHTLLRKICTKVLELDGGKLRYFGAASDYFATRTPKQPNTPAARSIS